MMGLGSVLEGLGRITAGEQIRKHEDFALSDLAEIVRYVSCAF